MEVKPGYKQTEVGVIPEDWEVKRLGDLFDVTSSKRVFQSEWRTQGVPFYRARELAVIGESGFVDNEIFIAQKMYDAFKRAYGVPTAGDMLVTGVGTLGKVYVVTGNHEFYFKDGNIIWFKIADSVSPEFLRQLYLMPLITKQISDGSAGTTVGTYTISGAKRTVIPFPPPSEQRTIVGALGDADALLDALTRLIAKKRDLKQATMQQLLTGQIRLPGFTGEWAVKRLDEMAEIRDGTHQTPKYVESGIPFFSVENVTSGNFTDTKFISEDEHRFLTRSFKIEKGDILMTRIGSIGDCKIINWDVDASFYVSLALVKIRKGYSAEFICHYSKIAAFKKEVELHSLQSAIPKKINLGAISNVRIKLPENPAEQTAIATVLTDMDVEIAALEKRLAKIRDLKQGMMQELLTGKTRLI